MQIKTNRDEFENYLRDASNMIGHAEKVLIPETVKEVSEILSEANARKIPITIAGARTGTVGGAVPFGGYVISLEKFDKVLDLDKTRKVARVQAGVLLRDFQKLVDAEKLFYPPDPTEWSCQIGGNIATNASGARSFKYGSTRNYVQSIKVALANGDVLDLRRGEILSSDGSIEIEVNQGNKIKAKLPTYPQPRVRKNTSGYFTASKVDAVDFFIGSEGTLGVVLEAELKLLDKPESFFSGIVFFENESDLIACVSEARKRSFDSRNSMTLDINATLLEYFDNQSLKFISRKFPEIPSRADSALFFEQETDEKTEDYLLQSWYELLEKYNALLEDSWFTTSEQDREKMRNFRHALPIAVNETIARYNQRKVGTDMAVPDENFQCLLKFYKSKLEESRLDYVIFGHIGDSHLHVNLLPKNDDEAVKAKHLYGRFVAQSIMLGGTVSAEHGIGKHKRKYLYVQMGERYINEMVAFKKSFDPNYILGRGNLFEPRFLD